MNQDTIFALATPQGRSGVAVIRISGSGAERAQIALCGASLKPRLASVRVFRDPRTGEALDRGVAIWFPGPGSFTGEDVLELQVHGSTAVLSDLLRVLSGLDGFRPAERGEFTRRAFVNGRLDLSEVEGLADLIEAETTEQRRFALRELEGATRERVEAWRKSLIHAMALFEAMIDFADEEDAPDDTRPEVGRLVSALSVEISAHLKEARRGERLRDGLLAVVAGPPNAGKSTLVNLLAGRDVAIVSDTAGTTRDAIEVRLDLDGLPVLLVDTAGLRRVQSADAIEIEGMRRTREHVRQCDVMISVEAPDATFDSQQERLAAERTLTVWMKADLGGPPEPVDLVASASDPESIGRIKARLASIGRESLGRGDSPVLARERHRFAFEMTVACLERAMERLGHDSVEKVAEDLRQAAVALGRVSGRVDVEDLLDVIFSSFCIGK
jgi:tRNA modification GTPase